METRNETPPLLPTPAKHLLLVLLMMLASYGLYSAVRDSYERCSVYFALQAITGGTNNGRSFDGLFDYDEDTGAYGHTDRSI